jgi:uncharacterized protein YprB with RNaseH-like and TPR domain
MGDHAGLRTMLAFDIETEGLDPLKHAVTCACVFNGQGVAETFLFKQEDAEEDRAQQARFIARLRGEQRFTDVDALAAQIGRDVSAARAALGRA